MASAQDVDLIEVNSVVLAAVTAISNDMPQFADRLMADVWRRGPVPTSALVAVLAVRLQQTLQELAEERGVPLADALSDIGRRLVVARSERDAGRHDPPGPARS